MRAQHYRVTVGGVIADQGLTLNEAKRITARANELAGHDIAWKIETDWTAAPVTYIDSRPAGDRKFPISTVEAYYEENRNNHRSSSSAKAAKLPSPKERRYNNGQLVTGRERDIVTNPETYMLVKGGKVLWRGFLRNLTRYIATHWSESQNASLFSESKLRKLMFAAKKRS